MAKSLRPGAQALAFAFSKRREELASNIIEMMDKRHWATSEVAWRAGKSLGQRAGVAPRRGSSVTRPQ